MKRTVRGWRRGESHQKARLTDEEVEQMRQLHEEYGLKPAEIASKFEANFYTVCSILNYRSRYA